MIARARRRPLPLYDAVNLSVIPPTAEAVAGYVDGRWPTFDRVTELWPRSRHLSIAVDAGADADALDVEAGDATPAQAGSWLRRQHRRGIPRPVLYHSLDGFQAMIDLLEQEGVHRSAYRLWSAHWTGRPHLCGPRCGLGFRDHAGATQWTDHALGRTLDVSKVFDASWFPHDGR